MFSQFFFIVHHPESHFVVTSKRKNGPFKLTPPSTHPQKGDDIWEVLYWKEKPGAITIKASGKSPLYVPQKQKEPD